MIGPNAPVTLHDHREGEPCNERCVDIPAVSPSTRTNQPNGRSEQ